FDRVRENLPRRPSAAFSQIVNRSMSEVITRSLATSFCTLLPILSLLLFGGQTLKDFGFALLVGVASGTYSSIFIASPVLTHWKEREPLYQRRRRVVMEDNDGVVPAYAEGTLAGEEEPPAAAAKRRVPGRRGVPAAATPARPPTGDGARAAVQEEAPPKAEPEPEPEPAEAAPASPCRAATTPISRSSCSASRAACSGWPRRTSTAPRRASRGRRSSDLSRRFGFSLPSGWAWLTAHAG